MAFTFKTLLLSIRSIPHFIHNFVIALLSDHGCYLNVSAWFWKNTFAEWKKIKLQNKQHFLENKTEVMPHVLKIQSTSLMPKHI
jgi:hypothetical protein